METLRPFVVRAGEGETIAGPAGGPTTFKARGSVTGGVITVIENIIGPKQGPPRHLHRAEDEMWFIVDGDFRFLAGESLFDAPLGSFVFVPRGTPHCFQNLEDRPSRILVLFTPSGMEGFFEEHSLLTPGQVDSEVYAEIAARSGMEVAGPTLALSHPLHG